MKAIMFRAPLSTPVDGPACRGIWLLATAIAILGSLGAASAAAGGLTIEKPWLRVITKEQPAAGYFVLHNDTAASVTLIGASSSACGSIMLHQSKDVGGVEEMLPVKSLAIPAHSSLSFSPGGYHLMCMSPDQLRIAGHVPVTLKFANGQSVTAQFAVQGVSSMVGPK